MFVVIVYGRLLTMKVYNAPLQLEAGKCITISHEFIYLFNHFFLDIESRLGVFDKLFFKNLDRF